MRQRFNFDAAALEICRLSEGLAVQCPASINEDFLSDSGLG